MSKGKRHTCSVAANGEQLPLRPSALDWDIKVALETGKGTSLFLLKLSYRLYYDSTAQLSLQAA